MESILQLKKEVKKLKGRMSAAESTINALSNISGAAGGLIVWKSTFADILATPAEEFDTIFAENYSSGDGIVTGWYKAQDDTDLIPNGTDIQQLTDGKIIVRFYVRESEGGSIGSSGTSYTVSRVISFPTNNDFLNSNIIVDMLLTVDANGQLGMFLKDLTASETGTNGVDFIVNLGGLHFRRVSIT